MFSIKYLYEIRNKFAFIYSGEDLNKLNSIVLYFNKTKENNKEIDLYLFVSDTLINDIERQKNIIKVSEFDNMKLNFPKYFVLDGFDIN